MSTSAVLNGIGTPNGEPTTGRFRYSPTNPGTCNDTFGTRVPAVSGTDLGSGSTQVPYSITTTGLTPGTTYYFCAIVSNASGTSFGPVLSFTIPYKPVVVTNPAASVTSSSATLQGAANPTAASTTAWFRYTIAAPSSRPQHRSPRAGNVLQSQARVRERDRAARNFDRSRARRYLPPIDRNVRGERHEHAQPSPRPRPFSWFVR